jgi:hypothetical protein
LDSDNSDTSNSWWRSILKKVSLGLEMMGASSIPSG